MPYRGGRTTDQEPAGEGGLADPGIGGVREVLRFFYTGGPKAASIPVDPRRNAANVTRNT